MSFIHCHKCGWQQDDFWDKSYNPVRYFFTQMVPTWIAPRRTKHDSRHLPFIQHSWWILATEFWHMVNPVRYWQQKWWTYKAWQRSVKRKGNHCPQCSNSLCID